MAIQGGPLLDVQVIGAPLEALAGIPISALVDANIVTTSLVGGVNYGNRFPTPPAAFGFLIDPELDLALDRVTAGQLIGVLLPEGAYLEPTIGQIWPRIG